MSLSPTIDADFETRWAAWQARGRVHNRLMQTRLRIMLPALALIVAAASYLLLVR